MTSSKTIHRTIISPADILIENLNHFAKAENIHEAELARQTNIPQPTLHKILTGKTTDPRISTLQILADYFGVTLDTLYTKTDLSRHRGALKGKPIPIISWSDCITYRAVIKKLSPANWKSWIITDREPADHFFALQSKSAMEPHFPKGTILIVDTRVTPKDGDLVVMHFENTNECTVRELSIDGRTEMLLPLNERVKSEKRTKSTRVVGVISESRLLY